MWAKAPAGEFHHQGAPGSVKLAAPGDDRAVLCARCHFEVTRESHRIEVDGKHRHFGTNMHAVTFEFGCFAAAPGCAPRGPASEHWSWFRGFSWTIVHCAQCAVHLGWHFEANDGHFFALVLERLLTRSTPTADV